MNIIEGDSLTVLRTLPETSAHLVVTSPPYWGLRDYGTGSWQGGSPDCDQAGARSVRGERNHWTCGAQKRAATFLGIELNPKYIEIARERAARHMSLLA